MLRFSLRDEALDSRWESRHVIANTPTVIIDWYELLRATTRHIRRSERQDIARTRSGASSNSPLLPIPTNPSFILVVTRSLVAPPVPQWPRTAGSRPEEHFNGGEVGVNENSSNARAM